VTRARSSRAAGIGLTAVALAATLLVAMASPMLAGPRVSTFGSPGADGSILLSPLQAGGLTEFRLQFQNTSGQSYNQVTVSFGDTVNVQDPDATGDSLPTGATVVGVKGQDASSCTPSPTATSPATGVTCTYGHVPKNGIRQVTIQINPGANDPLAVWAEAQINETQGTTNTDTFFAEGSTAKFVGDPNNQAAVLTDTTDTAQIATQIGDNGFAFGLTLNRKSNGVDALSIREGLGDFDCALAPTPRICFGVPAQLFANFGDAENVDVTVTSASNSTKYNGLLHQLDSGKIVDIVNDKSNACSANKTTNCILFSKQGVLIVRLPSNGGIKVH
jgi:hypothetical protein